MIQNEKIETTKEKPVILYSALDWGLGHTTRSIPLIREFLDQGCKVLIACNSIQKILLEQECTGAEYIFIEGYGISYGSTRLLTRLKLLVQVPNILTRIKFERSWISDFFSKNTVDAVVSDNRYGFRSPKKPSIFISHQLSAHTGAGKFFDRIMQRSLYKWIIKFDECWIPDYENAPTISGALGHPKTLPAIKTKYIGALSRFSYQPDTAIIYQVLVLLSGPEPQRTILESLIIDQLKNSNLKAIIIRGLPGDARSITQNNVQIVNHASSEELNQLILQSSVIVSRSGYTTVMDLMKLQKKMILIPTPGQPEQEYLATYLSEEKFALSFKQDKFSLDEALKKSASFDFRFMTKKMDDYKSVVREFVSKLK